MLCATMVSLPIGRLLRWKCPLASVAVPIDVPFTIMFIYGRCSPLCLSTTCPKTFASVLFVCAIMHRHNVSINANSIYFFILFLLNFLLINIYWQQFVSLLYLNISRRVAGTCEQDRTALYTTKNIFL